MGWNMANPLFWALFAAFGDFTQVSRVNYVRQEDYRVWEPHSKAAAWDFPFERGCSALAKRVTREKGVFILKKGMTQKGAIFQQDGDGVVREKGVLVGFGNYPLKHFISVSVAPLWKHVAPKSKAKGWAGSPRPFWSTCIMRFTFPARPSEKTLFCFNYSSLLNLYRRRLVRNSLYSCISTGAGHNRRRLSPCRRWHKEE